MLDTPKSVKRYQLCLFATFIISAVIFNTCSIRAQHAEEAYLKSLNLDLTLRVLDVKQTNNHGYGAIYGQVIKSNKPDNYTAISQRDYPFCKTQNQRAILITSTISISKGDSIVINSSKLKWKIFHDGKLLTDDYKLTFSTDLMLVFDIGRYRLFDFHSYR